MAACVNIPVAIPRDGQPTKSTFKTIISAFLQEWSSVDAEDLTVRSDTGHSDAHYFVQRPPHSTANSGSEMFRVFVKVHRDEAASITALKDLVPSKDVEAQLVARFGETGYGPTMIGFFRTEDGLRGRIDEMLDSRTLEPEDVERESIRADIARAHASLHALQVPGIPQRPVNSYYEAIIGGLNKYHKMERLKQLARQGGVDIDQVVDYDFPSRIRRVLDGMTASGAREGWCIHDVQYGNVLVKTGAQASGPRVSLIDFEFVFRNYRAVDIGGHWFQKMFKWTDEQDKVVHCRPYTDEEKRHFCEIYAAQWNSVTGDQDTGQQVYDEASLGYVLALVFDIHFMLMAMDEDDNDDPLDAKGLNKLFEEFETHYTELGLEDGR